MAKTEKVEEKQIEKKEANSPQWGEGGGEGERLKNLNPVEKNKRTESLFSFSAFHFLDDGFSDSIYLLLPFIAAELSLSFSQVGIVQGNLFRLHRSFRNFL